MLKPSETQTQPHGFALATEHVTKTFVEPKKHSLTVLQDVSLHIHTGEFFVIVGPSGCGKSTLLRIMSGLDTASHGTVQLAHTISSNDMSFVFQQFALLPWLTVEENIGMGLVAREELSDVVKYSRVERELTRFHLEKFRKSFPRELSGGMKQRVGIARALATDPKIIFMDEPFSALDSFTAEELRGELLEIWSERRPTIVMVTHNIPEALELGDRIAIMTPRPGQLERMIHNELPRPRAVRSPEFFALQDEIQKLIRL